MYNHFVVSGIEKDFPHRSRRNGQIPVAIAAPLTPIFRGLGSWNIRSRNSRLKSPDSNASQTVRKLGFPCCNKNGLKKKHLVILRLVHNNIQYL